MTPHAVGDVTDSDSVAIDGFVVVQQHRFFVDRNLDQAAGVAVSFLCGECFLAAEVFGPVDGEVQPSLYRGVIGGDLVSPVAIALLETERIQRLAMLHGAQREADPIPLGHT